MNNVEKKYFVIDFENTGGSLERGHKVTAVGLVLVEKKSDKYEITDKYSTLVNPEKTINPFVEKLIGIKSKDVNSTKYPKIDEVFEKLLTYFDENTVFTAHCLGVDYNMFNYLYKQKYGKELNCLGIDTHKLARYLLGYEKCSIGRLYTNYNFTTNRLHQPDFDAEVAANVLLESLTKTNTEKNSIDKYYIQLPKNLEKELKRKAKVEKKNNKRKEKRMQKT